MPNELFDTKQSADYLDVKPITMERWRRVGGGPEYVKIGRLVRYKRSALDAFIERNTVRPAGSSAA